MSDTTEFRKASCKSIDYLIDHTSKATHNISATAIYLKQFLQNFGHILRRYEKLLENILVMGRVQGKRPRGLKSKRLSDQVS